MVRRLLGTVLLLTFGVAPVTLVASGAYGLLPRGLGVVATLGTVFALVYLVLNR